MNKQLIASIVIAASAAIAAPAFASSGYGPAPHYSPSVGAPASQRGQSVQTINAQNAESRSYGGTRDSASQSGARAAAGSTNSLYSHN